MFGGGARGGGKSDGVLGDWLNHADQYRENAIGLMVRRTRVELLETHERARVIYSKVGAKFSYQPMRCVMANGARLTFSYLDRDSDADSYQGSSFSRVYVEEVGNFPSPQPILKLKATLRSGAGVPVGMRLTGNPGGSGHQWVRARYIDPAPRGWKLITDEDGSERIYLPSRVQMNRYLGADYVRRLRGVGTPELVKAWLEGDWSVIAGAFFSEWSSDRHIIAPRALPEHWARFRSFDWGSARPFAVHWWAVSDGSLPDIARGCLVCYREWYGMKPGEPNVGLHMTAEQVAEGIRDRERDDPKPKDGGFVGVADPSIFAEDGGPSIASRMTRAARVVFRPADNKRVPQRGAMGGWDQVRARLVGDADGKPMVIFFATARDIIRTLPALQHDDSRPEDVQTEGEDHAADSCFVAGTVVTTDRGDIPIECVRPGDLVATRSGLRPVIASFSVGEREVFEVHLSDETVLTGTGDHPVWIEGKGFIPLRSLRYGDITRPCKSSLFRTPSKSSTAYGITYAGTIFRKVGKGFTEWSGKSTTGPFQRTLTSTTKTMTNITTGLKTSFASKAITIGPIMAGCGPVSPPSLSLSTLVLAPRPGMPHQPGKNGTASIGRTIARTCIIGPRLNVSNAVGLIRLFRMGGDASAQTHVNPRGVGTKPRMILRCRATSAARHFFQTSISMFDFVRVFAAIPVRMSGGWGTTSAIIAASCSKPRTGARPGAATVAGEPMTAGGQRSNGRPRLLSAVVAAFRLRSQDPVRNGVPFVASTPTAIGKQKVFNLSVEQAEEYFANGILVHNCRYAMMSRPYIRDAERQRPRDSWDAAFNRDEETLRDWRVA